MTTFRIEVTLDYDVPDGTDMDEFHDALRDHLESAGLDFDFEQTDVDEPMSCRCETVRDINISQLDD